VPPSPQPSPIEVGFIRLRKLMDKSELRGRGEHIFCAGISLDFPAH
jgi:hypothetical protein